jgi:cysteine-rich repeat protein
VAALAALAFPVLEAEAAPPGLYVSSSSTGSVRRVTTQGDQAAVTPYSTGLSFPTGICVGPGANIYVADIDTGVIKVAYQGADLSSATAFATGLNAPAGMVCTATQILVANYGNGTVVDATSGGDLSAATPFASGLGNVVELFRASDGTLLATTEAPGNVFNITAGGNFASIPAFVTGTSDTAFGGVTDFGAQRLLAATTDIRIMNGGGPVANLPTFTTAAFTSMRTVENRVLGAGSGTGFIGEITSGSFSYYASGLGDYMFGLAYVPGCGSGIVEGTEECDDGNTVSGDGCTALCATEAMGTGGGGGAGGAGGAPGTGGAGGMGGQGGGSVAAEGTFDVQLTCAAGPTSSGGSMMGLSALCAIGLVVAARRRRR